MALFKIPFNIGRPHLTEFILSQELNRRHHLVMVRFAIDPYISTVWKRGENVGIEAGYESSESQSSAKISVQASLKSV